VFCERETIAADQKFLLTVCRGGGLAQGAIYSFFHQILVSSQTMGKTSEKGEGEAKDMSIVGVAKLAGVSIATVSRVLNDVPVVNPRTVEAVRRAVAELGYTPLRAKKNSKNPARRVGKLPQLRSNQIAVLAVGGNQGWLSMPVMASVLAGITRAAREYDLRLMLDEVPENAISQAVASRLKEVAGAIAFVMPHVADGFLVDLAARVPLVWVMGGQAHRSVVDHVSADNVGIGYSAFDYLSRQGCSDFAFITDSPGWPIMRARGQAFSNAARDHQRQVTSYIVARESSAAAAFGPRVEVAETLAGAVDAFLSARKKETGLFVPTDLLTTRIYPLLIERGVRPVADLKIVSCDHEDVRLAQLNPRPVSIDLGAEDIGRAAVRQLISRIAMPEAPIVRVQVSPRSLEQTADTPADATR
jgi:LacI family transcriptional regulator